MENASKALIIAGAILISIVIISFGIIIINNVRGNITGANVNEADTQAFNSKFQSYVGSGKTAAQIEQLIQAVMTNNISENSSGTKRFVQVDLGNNVVISGTTTKTYGSHGDNAAYQAITIVPTVANTKTYTVKVETYGGSGLIEYIKVE